MDHRSSSGAPARGARQCAVGHSSLVPPWRRNWRKRLADPIPARLEDGGAIRTGFDGELDAHRALRDESRQVIATMQLDFAQRFGVASLKIRHHAQLGYIIEAPSVAVEKLRGSFRN